MRTRQSEVDDHYKSSPQNDIVQKTRFVKRAELSREVVEMANFEQIEVLGIFLSRNLIGISHADRGTRL